MTAEEKESRGKVTLELSPSREIAAGERLCAMAGT